MIESQNQLFPIFLKLSEKKILIVGGGNIALEKLRTILRNTNEAWIFIVAPKVNEEIKFIVEQNSRVFIWNEEFNKSHLLNMNLVITATGIRLVAEEVKEHAEKSGILVNTADVPDLCDFYLGGVVIRGPIKIAISTNGQSPVMARRLREVLEEAFPTEAEISIEQLHELRKFLKGDFKSRIAQLNKATRYLLRKEKRKTRLISFKQRIFRPIQ